MKSMSVFWILFSVTLNIFDGVYSQGTSLVLVARLLAETPVLYIAINASRSDIATIS